MPYENVFPFMGRPTRCSEYVVGARYTLAASLEHGVAAMVDPTLMMGRTHSPNPVTGRVAHSLAPLEESV